MKECQVFQIILLNESVSIFVQYEENGGGSIFSFSGTGDEPRYVIQDIKANPFLDPRYAGSKLLGTMSKDDIGEAWRLCQAYVEDKENKKKHEEITDWCVVAAAMLDKEGLVGAKEWWTLPTIKKMDH
ncbi:hypothetical protein LEL_09702 [Akanthomyces lecanii RCEF 1005]|uniref:Uncharacterized protein n=1 Tax=Akanthomyces lecanii RCEF 1005 TaxID=1081108 RepID=A0A168C9F5_CORDF|nr:hypothetical protein LEL_09702 [Akanthomyces lecanii RCEF 1005]